MNKILSAALFGLLASGGAFAQSVDSPVSNGSGAYVGIKGGQSHWRADGDTSNEFGWGVQGGYRFAIDANQSIGPELGYVDFGKVKDRFPGGHTSIDGKAATLGASYRYSFDNSEVYLLGRAGYERWYGRATAAVDGLGYGHDSDHGNGYYAGVGVGYDLTPQASIVAQYDYHRANDVFDSNTHVNNGVASLGFEYRF